MTNREKYVEEIKNYKKRDFCKEFVVPKILEPLSFGCVGIDCSHCRMLQFLWLDEECEEPGVDWSKVKVDTPILVKWNVETGWHKRHFAGYDGEKVFAFSQGKTSWTVENDTNLTAWDCVKLAEEGDEK